MLDRRQKDGKVAPHPLSAHFLSSTSLHPFFAHTSRREVLEGAQSRASSVRAAETSWPMFSVSVRKPGRNCHCFARLADSAP